MLSEACRTKINHLVQIYPVKRTALIPALHVVQQELGYLPNEAILELGDIFGLSAADVEEVVTFYTMFYRKPIGKSALQVCTNISCLLRGGEEILNHLKSELGIGVGETTTDKKFTLFEVECIGACEIAPVMQVNFDFYGDLTIEKVDKLLGELRIVT